MKTSKKYTLEFDETPSLIFVQGEVGNDFKLYQDGEEVRGIRNIRIYAGYDDATTHEVEYLTGKTAKG
jgi:hypothetical protein